MAINIRKGKRLVFSVCGQMVKAPFAMQSSNKNDGQNILTTVAAVTTAPMAVTTLMSQWCRTLYNVVAACSTEVVDKV